MGAFHLMAEQTLILLKPDAVDRQLVGTIIQRYEQKGLKISAMKLLNVTQEMAQEHYGEHKEKPFFKDLVEFITSSPIVAMVLSGSEEAIRVARTINGATDPKEAVPGSIRGDLAVSKQYNLVHASDSPESAKREISIFFKPEEILSYSLTLNKWV